MRVALTGTPGTGKTTVSEHLDTSLEIYHLNEIIEEHGFISDTDSKRNSDIPDLQALQTFLAEKDDILFESHLAHYLPADKYIVLRCAPPEIKTRLQQKSESDASIEENVETEMLDIILQETVEKRDPEQIFEIDTTNSTPNTVANEIKAIIDGNRDPSFGTVSFAEYI
ncbi:MAG: adenylate kinase family protein [Halobacteriaceae archaeon]